MSTTTTRANSAKGQPAPTGQPSANHINDDDAKFNALRLGAQHYLAKKALASDTRFRESELRLLGRLAEAQSPAGKRERRGLSIMLARAGISPLVPMEALDG